MWLVPRGAARATHARTQITRLGSSTGERAGSLAVDLTAGLCLIGGLCPGQERLGAGIPAAGRPRLGA